MAYAKCKTDLTTLAVYGTEVPDIRSGYVF